MSNLKSLDQAIAIIGPLVQSGKIADGKIISVDPAVVKRKVSQIFKSAIDRSDYSYDPTAGEIIFTIPHHVGVKPLEKMSDGRAAGVHIREHFEEEGWDQVTILPERTGVERSNIKLSSSRIAASSFLTKTTTSSRKKG